MASFFSFYRSLANPLACLLVFINDYAVVDCSGCARSSERSASPGDCMFGYIWRSSSEVSLPNIMLAAASPNATMA